jgi:hypothetical protein
MFTEACAPICSKVARSIADPQPKLTPDAAVDDYGRPDAPRQKRHRHADRGDTGGDGLYVGSTLTATRQACAVR